jgi:hypothetical protein
MAMLKPERLNIGTSVGLIADGGDLRHRNPSGATGSPPPRPCWRPCSSHRGNRAASGWPSPVRRRPCGVGLAALHRCQIVAHSHDLGDQVELRRHVLHDLGLELDGPGLVLDVRALGVADQPVVAAIDPDIEAVVRISSIAWGATSAGTVFCSMMVRSA